MQKAKELKKKVPILHNFLHILQVIRSLHILRVESFSSFTQQDEMPRSSERLEKDEGHLNSHDHSVTWAVKLFL